MRAEERRRATRTASIVFGLVTALAGGLSAPGAAIAQGPGTGDGQWTYLGGDSWHTRYTPIDQIDPSNFEQLEIAWEWNATSFGPSTRCELDIMLAHTTSQSSSRAESATD